MRPLIKSWSDMPTTQISIFILFVSAADLFGGGFFLWVSLRPVSIKNGQSHTINFLCVFDNTMDQVFNGLNSLEINIGKKCIYLQVKLWNVNWKIKKF